MGSSSSSLSSLSSLSSYSSYSSLSSYSSTASCGGDCADCCFQVGTGLTWTAPCSGSLYLRFNDVQGQYSDNSGGFSAVVTGENIDQTLTVEGNDPIGPAISVTGGITYTITASGSVSNGGSNGYLYVGGPGGNSGTANGVSSGTWACSSANYGSLIGHLATGDEASLPKVMRRYAGGVHVEVPEVLSKVRTAYLDIMDQPWCAGVSITGSSLFRNFDSRDLDVIVSIKDMEAFEAAKGDVKFPRVIDGRQTDTFIHQYPEAGVYATMDVSSRRLYLPAHYKVLSVAPGVHWSTATPPRLPYLPTAAVRVPEQIGPLTPWQVLGPRLWADLHRRVQPNKEWLEGFVRSIPCGICRAHAKEWIGQNEPEFGQGWFAWTVRLHNDVNARLDKPQVTVPQARQRWLEQN